MMAQKPPRTKVFISYSHEDQPWLERLQVHLKPLEREGVIDRWDDTRITAGQKWKTEIKKALDQARVAVLLVSADFLASDFVAGDELPSLLAAAANEGLSVLPVILSPSRFARTPSLSQFQAVNDPARSLLTLDRGEQEDVWVNLAAAIEDILARPLPALPREVQPVPQADERKVCFVIQGFGKKTDFQSGRTLDLDRSYEVIREAAEEAGLRCIRGDEIIHATVIDVPTYEYLLAADVVVADLSTSNANVLYELGLRHALRPQGTVVVAENGFRFPFDISHMRVRVYEHMGADIGRMEAARFKKELTAAIQEAVAGEEPDSPLYTYLPGLQPPVRA